MSLLRDKGAEEAGDREKQRGGPQESTRREHISTCKKQKTPRDNNPEHFRERIVQLKKKKKAEYLKCSIQTKLVKGRQPLNVSERLKTSSVLDFRQSPQKGITQTEDFFIEAGMHQN